MPNVKGATRKTTSELALSGALDKHPQRYAGRFAEPKLTKVLGTPPPHMTVPQKKIWREIANQCAPGVLLASDRIVLEVICALIEKMRAGRITGIEQQLLLSGLGQLGMTPVTRSRISVAPKEKGKAEWAKLLRPTNQLPAVTAICTPNELADRDESQ